MEAVGMLIEALKQKQDIAPLERDIADTYHELQKYPFDISWVHQKIVSNNISYAHIFSQVKAQPQTVQKTIEQITEIDLRYILESQLAYLIGKERQALENVQ